MKYVILIYHNPESIEMWESFPPEERAAGLRLYESINEDLAASGELVTTEALADPSHAKRIAVDKGQVTVTDGPFAEMKEHLAGFYLVDCESTERAVVIASQVPEAELGLVEVRPVMSLGDFDLGGLEV